MKGVLCYQQLANGEPASGFSMQEASEGLTVRSHKEHFGAVRPWS